MKKNDETLVLRLAIAIIFLSHCLHGIIYNDVSVFGKYFLNEIGFAPFGISIAWTVILSQLIGSILLIFNKAIKFVALWFILILINGIVFVHFKEGWFVVGAGRNGMEYSFLLIVCLVQMLLQKQKKSSSDINNGR